MKKNVLLIAAALFLFLGNQSVIAQAKMKKEVQSIRIEKPEVKAKEMTTSLTRPLSLNKEQQEQVYTLFSKTEEKSNSIKMHSDSNDLGTSQAKMDKYVMSQMKEILNEKQFKKYLELVKDL